MSVPKCRVIHLAHQTHVSCCMLLSIVRNCNSCSARMGGEFVEPLRPRKQKTQLRLIETRNYVGGIKAKYKVTQLAVQEVCTLPSEIAIAAGKQEAFAKRCTLFPRHAHIWFWHFKTCPNSKKVPKKLVMKIWRCTLFTKGVHSLGKGYIFLHDPPAIPVGLS